MTPSDPLLEIVQTAILRCRKGLWADTKRTVYQIFAFGTSGHDEATVKAVLTGFDIQFRKAMTALIKDGRLERIRSTCLKFRNGRILHTGLAVELSYRPKMETQVEKL